MLTLADMEEAQTIMASYDNYTDVKDAFEKRFEGMTVLYDLVGKTLSAVQLGTDADELEKEYADKANLDVATLREVLKSARSK